MCQRLVLPIDVDDFGRFMAEDSANEPTSQEIADAFGYDEEPLPDVCPSGCQGGCHNCR